MSPQSRDWTKIAQSQRFRALLRDKLRFIAPVTAFFLAFYFALPLMTSYSVVLNRPAIGAITWAWIFAFAQFIMTWSLASLYTKRAGQFDAQVAEILKSEDA